jgi:hypothetical protein
LYTKYVQIQRVPKMAHYGVEDITVVNVRKMLKKLYWTHLMIWWPLKEWHLTGQLFRDIQ